MAKEQSQRAIRDWSNIFNQVDPVLDDFAKAHHAQVTKYLWDAPDRMLQWEADGAERGIHVYVEPTGHYLAFEFSAWIDEIDDAEGTRHWKLGKLPEDLPVDSIKYKLGSFLQNAYDQAVRWKKSEIMKSGKHSPLTSLQNA